MSWLSSYRALPVNGDILSVAPGDSLLLTKTSGNRSRDYSIGFKDIRAYTVGVIGSGNLLVGLVEGAAIVIGRQYGSGVSGERRFMLGLDENKGWDVEFLSDKLGVKEIVFIDPSDRLGIYQNKFVAEPTPVLSAP